MPSFRDPSASLEDRLDDLVNQLTLEEKAALLLHDAPAIERLGIQPYPWWSECLHGVARNGRATIFPQAIGLAATFDPDLLHRIGSAIADEARAKYEESVACGNFRRYAGLTFWTPNINIFRDPRWGRGQETYGEDPWLTARMGVALVQALQGDDPHHLKLAACAKHYAAHSGPEKLRHEFDAIVSEYDLRDTYLPAFEALVREAKVEIVMGAYNRTNGDPCCAHPRLLGEILRGEWNFDGHVVSDCWALKDFHTTHKITKIPAESAALAIKEGCDVNCGETFEHLCDAVQLGLLTEEEVNVCFRRAFRTRFRLGEFDPPESVPHRHIPSSVIACPAHLALSREAAAKSTVLLKNDGLLPLTESNLKKIYVTGAHAANLDVLMGNYYGVSSQLVSILEGVVARAPAGVNVEYRQGCSSTHPNSNPIDWVSFEAGLSDVTIACLGISPLHEGEEGDAIDSPDLGDRYSLEVPPHQIEFLRRLRERPGSRIVLVLTGGSPISSEELFAMADAVLWVWYPGEQGGHAVSEILFGDRNPAGRLPITFPRSLADLPPYEDYNMQGRTYRYSEAEPLFPFGFGLSYTTFAYEGLTLADDRTTATVTVRNTGTLDGDDVVQIYTRALHPTGPAPKQALVGFQRISLPADTAKEVTISLSPRAFQLVNEKGHLGPHSGEWEILAAGACPIPRSQELGAPAPLSMTIPSS
jgi:beta-glucosidase